jgi:pimeloyl-ACP methyl ester carboxylesterase
MVIGLAALVGTAGCIYTEQFRDRDGRVVPGSIATMETVTIGSVPQHLWIRGVAKNNPALILLHGGPGASEAALFRHYNPALEWRFLVVYWEQRGAGRSYHSAIPSDSMTVDQLLRDLNEVVELVRQRFGKDKVVLLAHSWGTVLGTIYAYRHPEKVAAYIGVAQMVHEFRANRLSCQFALSEAVKRKNREAIAELRSICPVMGSVDDELTLGKWVERFGGVFDGGLSTGNLIWAALSTNEANFVDLIKFGQGNRFSLESLWGEYASIDLTRYQSFDIPIFFILGRNDWHVPSVLAKAYFDQIEAPCKRLVWFEQAAHNPPFEQPEKFNEVMIKEVLPVVARTDTRGGAGLCERE